MTKEEKEYVLHALNFALDYGAFDNVEHSYNTLANAINIIDNEQTSEDWIKINSEDDLPKEGYGSYHVISKTEIYCEIPKNQNIEEFWKNDINKSAWWMENISHYQPIQKPQLPIY